MYRLYKSWLETIFNIEYSKMVEMGWLQKKWEICQNYILLNSAWEIVFWQKILIENYNDKQRAEATLFCAWAISKIE